VQLRRASENTLVGAKGESVFLLRHVCIYSPVRTHAATKMVPMICKEEHAAQYERPSHSLKGNDMCVIQHRQTKCPGSAMNMSEDKLLIGL
jgi:hypothetical protein